jgi:predicted ribosomally synthesized peptide with SipW-like signal peptide
MAAPPSDPPTRTLFPVEAGPRSDHTATHPPPDDLQFTKSFEGPDSPTSFPTPDDRYILMSFLARGGMGEVWIAKDRVLNREVALKLLREELQTKKSAASRFVEEARITGKLQHHGIPPIHDLGNLRDGRPFIAMKLIKGGRTLSDLLDNDHPDMAELLRIFNDICQAVAFAHDRRVIHRDLKPGNVMVGSYNEVQVMDWGLAKVLGESVPAPDSHPPGDQPTASPVSVIESDRDPSSHTKAGSLLGTPAYMPPEQAKGEIDRTDTRSDVFALGALLCELLTGKPPYWAATAAEIQALAIIGQIGPAHERLDGCGADPELVALAKTCLQLNPDDRPFDAKQVANAVKTHRDGVESRLRTAERDRAAAEAKAAEEVNTRRESEARRRVQVLLAAAAVMLIFGGGTAAWWADRQATEKNRIELEKQAELDRLESRQTAAARDRKSKNSEAITFLIQDANRALVENDADVARRVLEQAETRERDGADDELRPKLARCRKDLVMLQALDRTDDLLWTAEDYKLRSRRSTPAWSTAFKDYGVELGVTPVADAAKIIQESMLRERLLLALDLWWLHHSESRRPLELRMLLQAADLDPFRNEVRRAIDRRDAGWNMALLEDEQMFRQPARFVAVIGQVPGFNATSRERILRPALERSPNDFTLILTMVTVYESTPEFRLETATQQLRWAQAAVSVRPHSKVAWRNLGRAHWDKGQIEDAVRCYKRAVRLDEKDWNSWTQLGAVLLRKHDPEAAKEAIERALALNPDYSLAHSNLGSVFERMSRSEDAHRAFDTAVEIDAKNGIESHTYYNNRGFTRIRLGNLKGAISDFQQALRIRPDFRLAETNLNYARELRKGGQEPELAPSPREKQP